jgi:hypothetical protein
VSGSARRPPRPWPTAAWLLLAALPAEAYVLPPTSFLRRVVQRRADLAVHAFEVRGTLTLSGPAAQAAAQAAGLPAPAGDLAVPAFLTVKVPGRCRLELAPEGLAPASRPAAFRHGERAGGQRGLDAVRPVAALLEGACVLLADRGGGAEPERALAQALVRRGVDLSRETALARLGGRVAYVVGGRAKDPQPQAWFDKATLAPLRLEARPAGAAQDLRLLDYGAVGGEVFPQAAELWLGEALQARFASEKLVANPKVPDALFDGR